MQRIISGAKRLFRKKNHHRDHEANMLSLQSSPCCAVQNSIITTINSAIDIPDTEAYLCQDTNLEIEQWEASYCSSLDRPQLRRTSKMSALLYI